MPRAIRKSLGVPLPRTDTAQQFQIPSTEEIDALIARWDANCQPYYRGLLRSQPKGTKGATSKFLFDKQTGIYYERKSGRKLTRKEITDAHTSYLRKVMTK